MSQSVEALEVIAELEKDIGELHRERAVLRIQLRRALEANAAPPTEPQLPLG